MKIIVTDTNVFFDLMSIGILSDFFGLDYEISTTDFVVNEILTDEQAEQIKEFIRSKKLQVYSFTSNEIEEIVKLKTKRNLRRLTDKSVLWKALQLKCKLLTGDKNLRNEAEEQGLEVNGSLWVIDSLVEINAISPSNASALLEKLRSINGSLPSDRINKLIEKYRDEV
jgi:predicted nucleic acid-binding protein